LFFLVPAPISFTKKHWFQRCLGRRRQDFVWVYVQRCQR